MTTALKISRAQLAKICGNDHDMIRQFETLFSAVASQDTDAEAVEPEIPIETAGNLALARIERLERAFQMIELAPPHVEQVSEGGTAGAAAWGDITGTLSDQTDLVDAINHGVSPTINTSNAWDDNFTTFDTTKWTTFNSPSSVASVDGELVVGSTQAKTTNSFQGVYCAPPSTTEGYTIAAAFRLKNTNDAYTQYNAAGIGLVINGALYVFPLYMNFMQFDLWWGNWVNGVPTYSGSVGANDTLYSDRRILKIIVTATSVDVYSWVRNAWKLMRSITTTVLPTYVVLGVKHQSGNASITQGIFEWIKKIA